MITAKVDNKKRVLIPEARPGQVFSIVTSGEIVTLTPVKPVDPDKRPLVKMVKGPHGLMQFPDGIRLTREEIRAAIRADRDAQ